MYACCTFCLLVLNCYSRRDVEDKSSGLKVSTNTKLQVTSYKLQVCLFNFFFLLLFSNKMKSLFLFYRDTVLSHTAKYRMNDVTMIYRIVL